MRYLSIAFALVLIGVLPASGQLEDKVADRFWASTKILEQLVGAPDGAVPQDLLQRSECVGVIPAVKRAAFGIGGAYGRGLVICRTDGGTGPWGTPSMISLGGGSFGFQIGGQSTDVLMLFVSPESIEFLLRDKVTLGADVAVAAGPKGREISAATNPTMRAEILTYGRSRGLFAGISLEGSVLKPDTEANEALYGSNIDARTLLIDGQIAIPVPAQTFIETLTKLAARESESGY